MKKRNRITLFILVTILFVVSAVFVWAIQTNKLTIWGSVEKNGQINVSEQAIMGNMQSITSENIQLVNPNDTNSIKTAAITPSTKYLKTFVDPKTISFKKTNITSNDIVENMKVFCYVTTGSDMENAICNRVEAYIQNYIVGKVILVNPNNIELEVYNPNSLETKKYSILLTGNTVYEKLTIFSLTDAERNQQEEVDPNKIQKIANSDIKSDEEVALIFDKDFYLNPGISPVKVIFLDQTNWTK